MTTLVRISLRLVGFAGLMITFACHQETPTISEPTSESVRADVVVQATFTVTNTNDAGAGSLRQAILDANGNPGLDNIAFNIPGAGPHTIQPASALPVISDAVIIDGYTQSGASPNTNPRGRGSNAVLTIELDGSSAGGDFAHGVFITARNSVIKGLAINRFNFAGIVISNTLGGNVIEGNFIGTDVTGTVAHPNRSYGVLINFASNNTIGGTTHAARNVISGNGSNGVMVGGGTSSGNVVQGNLIGTDASGRASVGGAVFGGVEIRAAKESTIGGVQAAARNVLSGNDGYGVFIRDGATDNLVQGNFIGTDVSGTLKLGNRNGLLIASSTKNTIGGTTSAARNVISGNNVSGVELNHATGNLIQGNLIGIDVNGTSELGNDISGINLHSLSSDNIIGGVTAGAANVISANGSGVHLSVGTTRNLIRGNFIGTDVTGTSPLGNIIDGVSINGSSNNTIGGTTDGAANTVAFNGRMGVQVFPSTGTATGNAILRNSIFSNTGLGINLNPLGIPPGVTPNDAGDGDAGANNLQNFPVLTSATISGGSLTIAGDFNSTAYTKFRLEFFANTVGDPSGHGEGESFIGYTNVTTGSTGNASFAVTLPTIVPPGQLITATATDPENNTSEFSAFLAVEAIVRVTIDIRPGSDPNSVNCSSPKAVITLAILTNVETDATTVDHTTVAFEGASEIHADKRSGEPRRHEEDVDGDGDTDLVLHFQVGDTDLSCESTQGTLTGETFEGHAIEGTDAIRMVKNG